MEPLISAILDTVFASLAEAGGVSDWLRDRLGRDSEKRAFRAALTQALADAGQEFPGRDLRYFAEQLQEFGGPLLARTLQPAATPPTAEEWTRTIHQLSQRSRPQFLRDIESLMPFTFVLADKEAP